MTVEVDACAIGQDRGPGICLGWQFIDSGVDVFRCWDLVEYRAALACRGHGSHEYWFCHPCFRFFSDEVGRRSTDEESFTGRDLNFYCSTEITHMHELIAVNEVVPIPIDSPPF